MEFIRRLVLVTLAMALLAGTAAAQDIAALARQAKGDYAAVLAARSKAVEALNQRMAEDAARGAFLDFHVEARAVQNHRPLVMTFAMRGGRFMTGSGNGIFNSAVHTVDASGLTYGPDGKLTGTLKVTLNPDPWLPADHQPRYQEYRIDARVGEDGTVDGTYVLSGELGPEKDAFVGKAAPAATEVTIDEPTGRETVTADATGVVRFAELAQAAYRQLWACALALRDYPVSYEECDARNRLTPPKWDASDAEAVADAAACLARTAAIARAFKPAESLASDFAAGFPTPDDPRFGPYYKNTPLPAGSDGVAELPSETGTQGPQRWQYIEGGWQVTGPFPAPVRISYVVPNLPAWVPSLRARYTVQSADFPEHFVYPDWLSESDKRDAWNSYQGLNWFEQWVATKPATAEVHGEPRPVFEGSKGDAVYPERWRHQGGNKIPIYGVDRTFWFAHNRIRSDKDRQVWVECKTDDAGQVWVNDRLAWMSLTNTEGAATPQLAVFPVTLRKGVNHITARVRCDDAQTSVRLLFCTRGRPRTAAEALSEAVSQDGIVHGFRGNGTGSYPVPAEGRPPLAWDIQKGINMRWRQPLPSFTNSYPIIVGDKILTMCEPHTLYCFDKMTGKELWRCDTDICDVRPGIDRDQAAAVWQYVGTLNEDRPEPPELEALTEKKMAVDLKLTDEDSDKLTDKQREALQAESDALGDKIAALNRVPGLPRDCGVASPRGWWNWTGYSMPTPVSDGKHVWVKVSTGVAACYDLDGNRQWIAPTHLGAGTIAGNSSPVLLGDKLILEGGVPDRRDLDAYYEQLGVDAKGKGRPSMHVVVALDARTGEKLWQTPVLQGEGDYSGPNGPRGMRVSSPDGPMDIVISQRQILRASDGAVLHDSAMRPDYTGFTDGATLRGRRGVTAYWAESPDQIGLRYLLLGGGAEDVLCPNGMLFRQGTGAKGKWFGYDVVEGATARTVCRRMPIGDYEGMEYTPAGACGDYAYLVAGMMGRFKPEDFKLAYIVVASAKPPYQTLARSYLDSATESGPIFDGDRMYIRTRRSLMCMETTTDAGREYEFSQAVRELFDERAALPSIPQERGVVKLAPAEEPTPGAPVSKIYELCAPDRWLVSTPLAPGIADHFEAQGGAGAIRPQPGQAVGGATFSALDSKCVESSKGMVIDNYNKKHYRENADIDLLAAAGGKDNCTVYLYTVLEVTRPKAVTCRVQSGGARMWLAGRLMGQGDVAELAIGYYPLLVQAPIRPVPPFMRNSKVVLSPLVEEVPAVDSAVEAWVREVAPHEAFLREIGVRQPGSPRALRAKLFLEALERFRGEM